MKIDILSLEKALRSSWCRETSSDPKYWKESNPSLGQCGPTALLVQDYFKGDLLFGLIGYNDNIYGTHIWNILHDGKEKDLTREQYGNIPESCFIGKKTSREEALKEDGTRKRYEILKNKVKMIL